MTFDPNWETIRVYATLQFSGDALDPAVITRILNVRPTLAYRKGEYYTPRPNAKAVIGRTGVWYYSTRALQSLNIAHHLLTIAHIVVGSERQREQVSRVRDIVSGAGLRVVASCFWHGRYGAMAPVIPEPFERIIREINGTVELDFATDDEPAGRRSLEMAT
jgi:hypothetical protein